MDDNLPKDFKKTVESTIEYILDQSVENFYRQYYTISIDDDEITIHLIHKDYLGNIDIYEEQSRYRTIFGKQIREILNIRTVNVYNIDIADKIQDSILYLINYIKSRYVIVNDYYFHIDIFKDPSKIDLFNNCLTKIYSPEVSKSIVEVNLLSFELHDPKLRDNHDYVWTIRNDGDICNKETVYLNKHENRKLLDNKTSNYIVFPHYDTITQCRYAFVTQTNANIIKDKLEKIAELTVQN